MGTRDPRIDAYIEKSAPFAQPILEHLRDVVHSACPDVEETIKWSSPHFDYKGMMCGMSSFKEHCAFGFWKGKLIVGANGKSAEAMGNFGRITSLKDLPPRKLLLGYVKEAMRLNDEGIAVVKPKATSKPEAAVPADLSAALKKNKAARVTFEGFSSSQRREYVEWITEAKTDATRLRRLEQAVVWMAEGKIRNWKYVNC